MSEPTRVRYEILLSDENHSHVTVGVDSAVGPEETTEEALARVRAIVRFRIKADLRGMGDLRGWTEEAA